MNQNITDKLDKFFNAFTPVSFEAGDSLINGTSPSGVFYLKSGYIRQYAVDGSGNELLINIYKPNTFFPMTWAIADINNRHYFDAIGKVEAYRAPKEQFLEFLDQNQDVLSDLTRRLLVGLDATIERLENFSTGGTHQKVILALLSLARRFPDPEPHSVTITLNLKQEAIAAIAGTTKESLSRALSTLKKQGVIDINGGKITIKDMEMLVDELDNL